MVKITKLKHKLLVYVTVCSLILAFFLTSAVIIFEHQRKRQEIFETFEHLRRIEVPVISSVIYDYDMELLKRKLAMILATDHVVYAEFTDRVGTVKIGNPDGRGEVRKFPLTYDSFGGPEHLGTLSLKISTEGLYVELFKTWVFYLFLNIFVILGITLLISLIVQRLIIRHIEAMVRYTNRFSLDCLDDPELLALSRSESSEDELRTLVESINNMKLRLREQVKVIKESQDTLKSILKWSPDIIYRLDENGKITYISEAVTRYGYTVEELIGRDFIDLIDDSDKGRAKYRVNEKRTGTRRTAGIELHFKCTICKDKDVRDQESKCEKIKHNPLFLLDAEGLYKKPEHADKPKFVGTQGIAKDITERKKTQQLLIQNEKMMSVGGLAAGMAHEINNPLSGIFSAAQIFQSRLLNPDIKANLKIAEQLNLDFSLFRKYIEQRGIDRSIEIMHRSGVRIEMIVKNMLKFSRKTYPDDFGSQFSAPHQLIDEVLTLASAEYSLKNAYDFKNIKIVKEYDESITYLKCNEQEIEQVILNIFRNAAQAMNNSNVEDPTITVRTYLEEYKGNNYCVIEIEDNGPGLAPEVLERVFEPFFTTKGLKGTGLGLSISYMIVVNNHEGIMDVDSVEGEFTRFIIKLPIRRASRENPNNRR